MASKRVLPILRQTASSTSHTAVRHSRITTTLSGRTTNKLERRAASQRVPYICSRCLHSSPSLRFEAPPKNKDRGPKSKEDTQTDFGALNVLGNTPPPATNIDACLDDGFVFGSGVRLVGSGTLLAGGEVFSWKPWLASPNLLNAKGQLSLDSQSWSLLDVLWPKPDLLVIGTGLHLKMLAPEARIRINELGIRLEVLDTRNAAAQYNLLATERGIQQIAAALIPIGWKGGPVKFRSDEQTYITHE